MTTPITAQAKIQRLRIQNYRVLRYVEFRVFAFLHEAFTTNLRAAWDHRNRIRELRSRASDMVRVVAQADAGGLLGNLWMEGYFEAGDPLVRSGRPRARVGA